jgi:hypothetical protein
VCAKVCRVAAKGWRADAKDHLADAGPELRLRKGGGRAGGRGGGWSGDKYQDKCQDIPTPSIPPCAIAEPQPGEGLLGTALVAAEGATAVAMAVDLTK